tara:strand:+ start:1057 stop:1749 length:693 start_codon:yes stop_codon:yes gene_type:complete
MSKKTLLSETQIRQFMKYANIGGLTDNFLSKTQIREGKHELEEREHDLEERAHEMEEGMRGKEVEEGMHELEEGAHEVDEGMRELGEKMHADDEELDMGIDDEDAAPVGGAPPSEGGDIAEEVGLAVARAVRDALEPFGVSVDVEEGDEELGEEPDDGVDLDSLDVDLDMDDDDDDVMDLDEAVDRITKRVTRRIQKLTESRKRRSVAGRKQQIEDVTDRILERIKKISR